MATKAKKATATVAKKEKKPKKNVRVMKLELRVSKEDRHKLEVSAMRISSSVNFFFQRWIAYHTECGNRQLVVEAAERYSAWQSGALDSKPKDALGIVGNRETLFPARLVQDCIRDACEQFGMTQRAVNYAIRGFTGKMMGSSSSISMPLWWCYLAYRESTPSLKSMSTIQVDKPGAKGTRLYSDMRVFPDANGDTREKQFWMFKSSLPVGTSFSGEIMARGKGCAKYLSVIQKIVDGSVDPAGVTVVRTDNKWFVTIGYCVEEKSRSAVQKGTVAFLAPGIDCPWMLCVPTDTGLRVMDYWASDGVFLKNARENAINEERSVKASMRFHGSGSRGHGRGRATRGLCRSSDRWKGVIGNYNKHMVSRCVDLVVRFGIESLVMLRPDTDSDACSKAFLASAGTDADSSWARFDWFNVMNMLRTKSLATGVKFEDRKSKSLFTKESLIEYVAST